MKPRLAALLAVALAGVSTLRADPLVYVAIATHNEDPANPNTPDTPLAQSLPDYANFRRGIYYFANRLQGLGIPWNWQSEWNFLEGARQWEITTPQSFPDDTGGLNIVRWLREARGVECNAHSHEGFTYNYADVAWLLRTHFAVPDSHLDVVGGHIYPSIHPSFQHWERFHRSNGDGTTGLAPAHYAAEAGTWRWNPRLLMGAGTPLHVLDARVSGVWKPAALDNFFTHADAGTMHAIGNAGGAVAEVQKLIYLIESGQLEAGRMRTATFVFDSALFYQPSQGQPYGQVEGIVSSVLTPLKALEAAGKIAFIQFRNVIPTWQTTFASVGSVWPPQDCISFHWNVQDFARPATSAAWLHRLLDLHEAQRVPADVFLTGTMIDRYEQQAPALVARLRSSAVAALSYHVRAPKPYDTGYNLNDWSGLGALSGNTGGQPLYEAIRHYETHGLDLATGQPTTAAGGFAKLPALFGYSGHVGAFQADPPFATATANVFRDLGARFTLRHNVVNNLGETQNLMIVKPEAGELRLIERFEDGLAIPAATAFESAVAAARVATSGAGAPTRYAYAPYFTGVKLHDDDLHATQSAWATVYLPPTGRRTPPWTPSLAQNPLYDLAPATQEARYGYYRAMVEHAAANRARLRLVHAPDILEMLEQTEPLRITLSRTRSPEAVAGTALAQLGLTTVGTGVTYELVPGAGSDDNARFTLVNGELRAAALDFETKPVLILRVRATVLGGGSVEQVLSFVLTNATDDDDDADGFTEAQENAAGTDPLDPASHLRVLTIARSGTDVALTWTSVPGKSYAIEYASALPGTWSEVSGGPFPAAGATTTRTIAGIPDAMGFFRVRVP
jgi:hypothetical protein